MSDERSAFDALTEEFFSVWFRYHPDAAAEAGMTGFERFLPAQSDDELSALGAWLETLVVALEELDYAALDPDRQLDLRLMFGAARVEHQQLLERDWRHRDPLRFLPVGEIYHLALQPPPDIRDVLAALLASLPGYLRLALSQLRSMAELTAPEMVGAAIDEAERGCCYLRELVSSSWIRRHCYSFSEIEALADLARGAIAAYAEELQEEISDRAAGRLGCGEAHLRFLLRHRHFLELEPARARDELDDALALCEDELDSLLGRLGIGRARIWERLGRRTVDPSRNLEVCRRESERLAGLLARAGLFGLPGEELLISERPACPLPRRFGADYMPSRKHGRGTYFPGRFSCGDTGPQPLVCLRSRCLDKTWGGEHLLAFAGGEAASRLPRRMSDGSSLDGAWALYLRDLLARRELFEPDDLVFAVLYRHWAIQLARVDLDLHTGAVDAAAARERIARIGNRAGPDLIGLARRPGRSLAGVLGWIELSRTRERAEERAGAGFREKDFHDRLLGTGRIPLPLVLSELTAAENPGASV
jgi:hypothetical protein